MEDSTHKVLDDPGYVGVESCHFQHPVVYLVDHGRVSAGHSYRDQAEKTVRGEVMKSRHGGWK